LSSLPKGSGSKTQDKSFGYALWSALMDKGIPEKPGMLLPFNKLKVSLALMYNVSKSLLDNNTGQRDHE